MWKWPRRRRHVDELREKLQAQRAEWEKLFAEVELGGMGSTSSRLNHIDARLRRIDDQFREIHARLDRIEGIR